jgi:hypothetical protein
MKRFLLTSAAVAAGLFLIGGGSFAADVSCHHCSPVHLAAKHGHLAWREPAGQFGDPRGQWENYPGWRWEGDPRWHWDGYPRWLWHG